MVFPTDRLTFRCEAAFGVSPDVAFVNPIAWSNLTPYFLDQTVSIARGRANETDDTQVMTLGFELDNLTGVFTPDNAESILYPYVRRGVLCRYGIYGGQSFLQLPDVGVGTNYISTPDNAALDMTAEIDIAFEIQPYAILAGNSIIQKWSTTGNQRSWQVIAEQDTAHPSTFRFSFRWSTNGTTVFQASTTYTFSYMEKLSIRVTFDSNPFNHNINWYAANRWGDEWILFAQNQGVGTSSIFNSTSPVVIGGDPQYLFYPFLGKIFRAQIKSTVGGTLVADPDFTTKTPGTTTFTDSATRVWTMAGSAAIDNLHTRFFGQIDSYEMSWPAGDSTAVNTPPDCRVSVQASSIRRKLGQGEEALESPLRREFVAGLSAPVVAYWPLEDGAETTKASSGLPNFPAATVTGMTFESNDTLAGSASLPELTSNATFNGAVPAYTDTAAYHTTGFITFIPAVPSINQPLMRIQMTGSSVYEVVLAINSTNVLVNAYDKTGEQVLAGTSAHGSAFLNVWGYWLVAIAQNGTGVDIDVYFTPAGSGAFPIGAGFNIASSTMGRVKRVKSEFGSQLVDMAIGHISVVVADAGDAYSNAITGRSGEGNDQRFRRLCDEEGIAFNNGEVPTSALAMGAQTMDTLLNLLEEAAVSGNAIFLDARHFNGLQFIPLYDLVNQGPQLVLDAALEHITNPLNPTLDDQLIRNSITSTRVGGGSATQEDEDSIEAEGLYSDAVTVNVESDDQLPDDANWRLHLGTQAGMTYPPISIEMAKATAALISKWLEEDTDIGCVVTLANLPRQADTTLKRFILQGYTETISPTKWTVTLNCTRYQPYEVTAFNNQWTVLRLDAENSTLDAGINAVVGSLVVNLNGGAAWTAADQPFDIQLAGEFLRVTAVSAVVSDKQTFTVTRSINGVSKAQVAGAKISLAYPVAISLI